MAGCGPQAGTTRYFRVGSCLCQADSVLLWTGPFSLPKWPGILEPKLSMKPERCGVNKLWFCGTA
jgi:hypothetical protein